MAHRAVPVENEMHEVAASVFRNLVAAATTAVRDSSVAAREWTLHVREDSRPIARCYPGGTVVVSTTIIDFIRATAAAGRPAVDADSMIASVLAHEMAHGIADHAGEEKAVLIASGAITAAIAVAASAALRSPTILSPLVGWFLFLQYQSRVREREADAAGQRILAAAGYNVDATEVWWRLRPSRAMNARNRRRLQSDGAPGDSASASAVGGAESGSATALPSPHGSNGSSTAVGEPSRSLLHRMSDAVERALGLLSAHPRDAERAEAAAALAQQLRQVSYPAGK